MGYYAKLKCGRAELNLNDGPYGLAPSFVPPEISIIPLLTDGSLGSPYGGGSRVGRTLIDRGYNLPIQVSGSTGAQTHQAVRHVEAFIENNLVRRETLYFVFGYSDAIPYEPKWGQQFYYFEFKERVGGSLSRDYGLGANRATRLDLNLALVLGPESNGLEQRAGSAMGGIIEDIYGTSDKKSRGLMIPPAARNYVLNPIFGAATFNADWTDGSGIDSYENTDEEFVLWGEKSAKVVAHGASGRYFRNSVDLPAEACLFSCYAKKQDGSAVTSTDVVLVYNGSGLTETYTAEGDGWYRIYARGTGTGAPANYDINFGANVTVFLDGVQVEATNFPTPLIHGDLLGCAWDGTAHTDESTRTAAQYYLSDPLDIGQGTILCIWKAKTAESLYDGNVRIFVTEDSNYDCYYNVASNEFAFADGTNTVAVSAAVADGDIFVIIATWGPEGIALYINDASDTDSSYAIPTAVPDYLYLGRTAGGAGYCAGTFLDLMILSQPLSATQAAAAYTEISAHITGGDGLGQRLNPIPWHWTKDGDEIYDNCYDSTRQNWGVVGGVPGSLPAKTVWSMGVDSDFGADNALFLAIQPYFYEHLNPTDNLEVYDEMSGSATTSADSNSDIGNDVISTLQNLYAGGCDLLAFEQYDRDYYLYVRMSDAGSDLQARAKVIGGVYNGFSFTSDLKDIVPHATTRKAFELGPIFVPGNDLDGVVKLLNMSLILQVGRTTGSAALSVDYIVALPERMKIQSSASEDDIDIVLSGKSAFAVDRTSRKVEFSCETSGFVQDLWPDKANLVMAFRGDHAVANVVTRTIDFKITVTPRWMLL